MKEKKTMKETAQVETITRMVNVPPSNTFRALFEIDGKPIVYMDIDKDQCEGDVKVSANFANELEDADDDTIDIIKSYIDGLSKSLDVYMRQRDSLKPDSDHKQAQQQKENQ